jgi:hypothetical protein
MSRTHVDAPTWTLENSGFPSSQGIVATRSRFRSAAAGFALAVTAAHAQLTPDPTGYWFDPAQPGWGAYVAQQDNSTVSVTLFVYDEAGRPTFSTSSRMAAVHVDPLPPEPLNAADGSLLHTTGPWFGGPFQPPVVFSDAGFVDVWYPVGTHGEVLMIDYILDGHHVQKALAPMTIAASRALLAGRYTGGVVLATAKPAGCAVPAAIAASRPDFTIDATTVRWSTSIDTACTLTGSYTQRGQLGTFSGDLACGAVGGPSSHYGMSISALSAGTGGVMGKVTVVDGGCTYTGRIGGVRP